MIYTITDFGCFKFLLYNLIILHHSHLLCVTMQQHVSCRICRCVYDYFWTKNFTRIAGKKYFLLPWHWSLNTRLARFHVIQPEDYCKKITYFHTSTIITQSLTLSDGRKSPSHHDRVIDGRKFKNIKDLQWQDVCNMFIEYLSVAFKDNNGNR